jgi:hypothetical protein
MRCNNIWTPNILTTNLIILVTIVTDNFDPQRLCNNTSMRSTLTTMMSLTTHATIATKNFNPQTRWRGTCMRNIASNLKSVKWFHSQKLRAIGSTERTTLEGRASESSFVMLVLGIGSQLMLSNTSMVKIARAVKKPPSHTSCGNQAVRGRRGWRSRDSLTMLRDVTHVKLAIIAQGSSALPLSPHPSLAPILIPIPPPRAFRSLQ